MSLFLKTLPASDFSLPQNEILQSRSPYLSFENVPAGAKSLAFLGKGWAKIADLRVTQLFRRSSFSMVSQTLNWEGKRALGRDPKNV